MGRKTTSKYIINLIMWPCSAEVINPKSNYSDEVNPTFYPQNHTQHTILLMCTYYTLSFELWCFCCQVFHCRINIYEKEITSMHISNLGGKNELIEQNSGKILFSKRQYAENINISFG